MERTNEQNEHKPLSAKELCEQLEIADSTFRKWCIFIENNSKHHFTRASNSRNKRLFYPSDINSLEQFKHAVTVKFSTLEDACKTVFPASTTEPEDNIVPVVPTVPEQSELHELRERLNEQDKKINSLYEYINTKVAERDHNLMAVIREIQLTKILVAPTEQPKVPWWKRLFK